jgi:hypothetical protein
MTKELHWEDCNSDTVEAFAYEPEYGDLVIRFRSGGSYKYANVDEGLVKALRKNHPWHKIGAELRDPERHPFEKLGSIRTRPLKGRTIKAKRK